MLSLTVAYAVSCHHTHVRDTLSKIVVDMGPKEQLISPSVAVRVLYCIGSGKPLLSKLRSGTIFFLLRVRLTFIVLSFDSCGSS